MSRLRAAEGAATETRSRRRATFHRSGSRPLTEWLLGPGREIGELPGLVTGLAVAMTERGMPVTRLRVDVRVPHTLVEESGYEWRRDVGVTPTIPLEGGRAPAGDAGHADFSTAMRLHDVARARLVVNVDRPGGLLDREREEISAMAPILAVLLDNQAIRQTAGALLETYIGRYTGRRVLNGQIERGAGEQIHAVIWYCDLRDSTRLAESLSPDSFLGALNDYFDCMAGAVLEHGGEVLRFIGDAALAIFPITGTSRALEEACTPSEGACRRALDAARDARRRMQRLNERRERVGERPLAYGLALHVGDVMYGNIGVPRRLEFTVVGRAANEAARLEGMTRELGEPILISAAFPRCFPDETRSLGTHRLRGVSEPQEIFALAD